MGTEHYSVTLIAEPSASAWNYAKALVESGRQVNFVWPSDLDTLLSRQHPKNHFFVCHVRDIDYIK